MLNVKYAFLRNENTLYTDKFYFHNGNTTST